MARLRRLKAAKKSPLHNGFLVKFF